MLFSRFSRQDSTLHVMLCSAFILKFIIAVAALAVAGIIIIITRTFEVKHFKNLREANRQFLQSSKCKQNLRMNSV